MHASVAHKGCVTQKINIAFKFVSHQLSVLTALPSSQKLPPKKELLGHSCRTLWTYVFGSQVQKVQSQVQIGKFAA